MSNKFEHISHFFLVFLLFPLRMYLFAQLICCFWWATSNFFLLLVYIYQLLLLFIINPLCIEKLLLKNSKKLSVNICYKKYFQYSRAIFCNSFKNDLPQMAPWGFFENPQNSHFTEHFLMGFSIRILLNPNLIDRFVKTLTSIL